MFLINKNTFWGIKKTVVIFTIITFIFSNIMAPIKSYSQELLSLPLPGTMVPASPSFAPVIIKGIKVSPENPLSFDFIVDVGDGNYSDDSLKAKSAKLIRYFLAALTVPEDDLWVNLSPYEKDRIVPDKFSVTEMGRDLLAQDYILKQLTASMMYPEDKIGEKFWSAVYQKTYEKYGKVDIKQDAFNKVWIVPEKAVVYTHGDRAFVVESKLKVLMESDYVARQKNNDANAQDKNSENESHIQTEIIKEIIIPELEKEVNEGENFASLRQIYNSLILATWFKRNLKESILSKVYVGKKKIKGIDLEDEGERQRIYEQYLKAFKMGVYDYVKEEYDPNTKSMIPRKYFSGGVDLSMVTRSDEFGKAMHPAYEETTDEALAGEELNDISRLRIVPTNLTPEMAVSDKAMVSIPAEDFRYEPGKPDPDPYLERIGSGNLFYKGQLLKRVGEGGHNDVFLYGDDIVIRVMKLPGNSYARSKLDIIRRLADKDLVPEIVDIGYIRAFEGEEEYYYVAARRIEGESVDKIVGDIEPEDFNEEPTITPLSPEQTDNMITFVKGFIGEKVYAMDLFKTSNMIYGNKKGSEKKQFWAIDYDQMEDYSDASVSEMAAYYIDQYDLWGWDRMDPEGKILEALKQMIDERETVDMAMTAEENPAVKISNNIINSMGIKEIKEGTQAIVSSANNWPFVIKRFKLEGADGDILRKIALDAYSLAFNTLGGIVVDFTFAYVENDSGEYEPAVIMRKNRDDQNAENVIEKLLRENRDDEAEKIVEDLADMLFATIRRGVVPVDFKLKNIVIEEDGTLLLQDPGVIEKVPESEKGISSMSHLLYEEINLMADFLSGKRGGLGIAAAYLQRIRELGLDSTENILKTIKENAGKDAPVGVNDISGEIKESLNDEAMTSIDKLTYQFNEEGVKLGRLPDSVNNTIVRVNEKGASRDFQGVLSELLTLQSQVSNTDKYKRTILVREEINKVKILIAKQILYRLQESSDISMDDYEENLSKVTKMLQDVDYFNNPRIAQDQKDAMSSVLFKSRRNFLQAILNNSSNQNLVIDDVIEKASLLGFTKTDEILLNIYDELNSAGVFVTLNQLGIDFYGEDEFNSNDRDTKAIEWALNNRIMPMLKGFIDIEITDNEEAEELQSTMLDSIDENLIIKLIRDEGDNTPKAIISDLMLLTGASKKRVVETVQKIRPSMYQADFLSPPTIRRVYEAANGSPSKEKKPLVVRGWDIMYVDSNFVDIDKITKNGFLRDLVNSVTTYIEKPQEQELGTGSSRPWSKRMRDGHKLYLRKHIKDQTIVIIGFGKADKFKKGSKAERGRGRFATDDPKYWEAISQVRRLSDYSNPSVTLGRNISVKRVEIDDEAMTSSESPIQNMQEGKIDFAMMADDNAEKLSSVFEEIRQQGSVSLKQRVLLDKFLYEISGTFHVKPEDILMLVQQIRDYKGVEGGVFKVLGLANTILGAVAFNPQAFSKETRVKVLNQIPSALDSLWDKIEKGETDATLYDSSFLFGFIGDSKSFAEDLWSREEWDIVENDLDVPLPEDEQYIESSFGKQYEGYPAFFVLALTEFGLSKSSKISLMKFLQKKNIIDAFAEDYEQLKAQALNITDESERKAREKQVRQWVRTNVKLFMVQFRDNAKRKVSFLKGFGESYDEAMTSTVRSTQYQLGDEVVTLKEINDIPHMREVLEKWYRSDKSWYFKTKDDEPDRNEAGEIISYFETPLEKIKNLFIVEDSEGEIVGISDFYIGTVMFSEDDLRSNWPNVTRLEVAEDQRGKGIGKLLMAKVLEKTMDFVEERDPLMMELGGKVFVVHPTEDNSAIEFYRSLGFTDAPLPSYRITGDEDDALKEARLSIELTRAESVVEEVREKDISDEAMSASASEIEAISTLDWRDVMRDIREYMGGRIFTPKDREYFFANLDAFKDRIRREMPYGYAIEGIFNAADSILFSMYDTTGYCFRWASSAAYMLRQLKDIVEDVKVMKVKGFNQSWVAVKFKGVDEWYAIDRTVYQIEDISVFVQHPGDTYDKDFSNKKEYLFGIFLPFSEAVKVIPYYSFERSVELINLSEEDLIKESGAGIRAKKFFDYAVEKIEAFYGESPNEMIFPEQDEEQVGGIDLNPESLFIEEHGNKIDFELPDNIGEMEKMNIEGFYPVILNIMPVTNLPLLLGIKDKEGEDPFLSVQSVKDKKADKIAAAL